MTSNWPTFFRDYARVRELTALLFCLGMIITSAEYLAIRKEFADRGKYSWLILSSRPEYLNSYLPFKVLHFLFGYSAFVAIHVAIIVCCILLPISSNHVAKALLISVVAACSLVMSFRNVIGNDGADQMSRVICLALCVAYWSQASFASQAALVFIASQAVLAYTAAGIAKLCSRKWRVGAAVYQIMNTENYGHQRIAAYLATAPRVVNQLLCWSVIAVEALFGLVLVTPAPQFAWILIGACGFHLYNAAAMGLNNFVWAFLATYPAIVFVNQMFT